MARRACEPIESGNHDGSDLCLSDVGHQAIKIRPILFAAGNPDIQILVENLPAARRSMFAQWYELGQRILTFVFRALNRTYKATGLPNIRSAAFPPVQPRIATATIRAIHLMLGTDHKLRVTSMANIG